MFERIVWSLVSSFILRQIEKFKTSIDWEKVKDDAETRIRKMVPGTWFDDEAAEAVRYIIETVAIALGSKPQFEDIINLVATEKHDEASQRLKDLLVCSWNRDCAVPKAKRIVLS